MNTWSFKILIISFLFSAFTAASFKTMDTDSFVEYSQNDSTNHFLDSTIEIPRNSTPGSQFKLISNVEAETALYSHFEQKGILSYKKWQKMSTTGIGKKVVVFNTLYPLHLTDWSGGVVSYWIGEPGLIEKCYQPQKALLVKAGNKSEISVESFLPASFIIDSVYMNQIYGYKFDCGGKEKRENFRLSIK